MSSEKENKFYILLEKMIIEMTDPEAFSRERFVAILTEICELFHIAKGVTEFYRNVGEEQRGHGEILIDYDNGHGDVAALSKRFVVKSGAVIKGTLYVSKDEPPLSESDLAHLDVAVRSLMSFISRNRLQDAIERFAFNDENDYPNLRAFSRFVERINYQNGLHGFTAICLNLQHFTLINQDIGRQRGDIVMRNYTILLAMAAGEDSIVCRMGGDNFAMVIRTEMLNSVLSIISGVPVMCDDSSDKRVMVSASAGIFVVPEGFRLEHPGVIIERIYGAMHIAKSGEHGSVIYYDHKMHDMRNRAMRTLQDFFASMEKNEIHAFYQPKIDVMTGRIVGAEALCRWIVGGKIIPPGEFIPLLEQSSDICRLDFHMLDIVCRDIKRWLEDGRNVPRVSVNLSRKHLTDVDLLSHIMKIIEKHDIPHTYIEIELTETTTDVAFRELSRVVGGLHDEGISTSVDDFGMGYSSLNLIREIPWNVLKIDRSFLPADDEPEDSVTSLMFKHVVAMARDIGLECVTEGVETLRQVEILRTNNCHIAQGFYFDRPMPVDEFEKKLDKCYDVSAG